MQMPAARYINSVPAIPMLIMVCGPRVVISLEFTPGIDRRNELDDRHHNPTPNSAREEMAAPAAMHGPGEAAGIDTVQTWERVIRVANCVTGPVVDNMRAGERTRRPQSLV
jgi:hypothetical protein